ncbi:GNAT family N-acetyltransferase [Rhizobium sp. NZLR4b]|uniref:GNAT family N-acetyltransferase n=1 Tax=Rhizobium sp. NZLR4b TaxID=2731102 RepID=UPI001C837853|nr:N-acetyltransferase [Rhizobium sp. NZLR4b]MBX5164807.1 GNAT family N-acetyltransferase [Rhizobium sp. NZLR4b]
MVRPTRTIRIATTADAPALGVIGPAAYAASYGYLWDDPLALSEQLHTFSANAFSSFMCRENTQTWIAEVDSWPVGFLTMVTGSPDPITFEGNGAEIPRIYLLPGAQGHGLGRMLIDAAMLEASSERLGYLWLDVMASATNAIDAYRRWGFVDIGTKPFARPVKMGFKNMIVLRKPVPVAIAE